MTLQLPSQLYQLRWAFSHISGLFQIAFHQFFQPILCFNISMFAQYVEDLITMAGVFYTNQNRKERRKLGMSEIRFRNGREITNAIHSISNALKMMYFS